MMGNDDDASDVLQDAFIHAFSKLNNLNDKALFPGWLKKIVLNHCIDALRKRKQFEMVENQQVYEDLDENGDWSGYQVNRILKAMDSISVGYRTVLNLYVFEGYDHQEIGEILNISTSTSRAQYSKAKEKIRQVLSLNVN